MISINNTARIAAVTAQNAVKTVEPKQAASDNFDKILFSAQAEKFLGGKDIHLDVMHDDRLNGYTTGVLSKLLERGDIKLTEYDNELFRRSE